MSSIEKGTTRWKAELYHSARPSYPIEAIQIILQAAAADVDVDQQSNGSANPKPKPLRILEIGSGTGISTEAILRGATSLGLPISEYLAIEPSLDMRKGWDDYMLGKLVPDLQSTGELSSNLKISCRDGTFEELSTANETGGWDLVLIAQAYHWCPDYTKSLTAIAEVLRTGGKLALLWNLEDRETGAKWVGKLRDLYEAFEDEVPQYHHMAWKKLYHLPILPQFFQTLPEHHLHRSIPTTLSGVINRALSKSFIARLDDAKKDQLIGEFEKLFKEGTDEELGRKWIDKEKGIFEYPYRTDVFLFRKK